MNKPQARTRRGKTRKENIRLMYANVRGLKSKTTSLYDNITTYKPHIVCLVETMLSPQDIFVLPGYKTFKCTRQNIPGGGVMIMIAQQYANTTTDIFIGDETNEQICIKLKLKQKYFYIVALYGKIESRCDPDQLAQQYEHLDQHIKHANRDNAECIIVGDFNAKIGKVINGNDDKVNKSGKYLQKVIKNNDLVVVNATEKCHGLWTRQNTQRTTEHAVIDYFLCTKRAYEAVKTMRIDNSKILHFSRYCEDARANGAVDSDHYTITVELNINAIPSDGRKRSITTLSSNKSWQKYKQLCEKIDTSQFQTRRQNISAQSEFIGQHLLSTASKCASTRQIRDGIIISKSLRAMLNRKRSLKHRLSQQLLSNDPQQLETKIRIKWINNDIAKTIHKERSDRIQHMTEKLSTTKGLHDKKLLEAKKENTEPKG